MSEDHWQISFNSKAVSISGKVIDRAEAERLISALQIITQFLANHSTEDQSALHGDQEG